MAGDEPEQEEFEAQMETATKAIRAVLRKRCLIATTYRA